MEVKNRFEKISQKTEEPLYANLEPKGFNP